jgi:hypothetical protein
MAPRCRTTPQRDASLPPGAGTAITPACPTSQLRAPPPLQAATHPASLTAAATTGSPLHNGFHPIAPQNPAPPAEPPPGSPERFFLETDLQRL